MTVNLPSKASATDERVKPSDFNNAKTDQSGAGLWFASTTSTAGMDMEGELSTDSGVDC